MGSERVEVVDLSAGADEPGPDEPGRADWRRIRTPVPRLTTTALACVLLAGIVGAHELSADAQRRRDADAHLRISVSAARPDASVARGRPVTAQAAVRLDLLVSVPVRVLDAELDGAPPVTRVTGRSTAKRTPSVTVRWTVLCAEVGTIPGPRLLDLDVRARTGDQHRRVRLSTSDTDPVARVFRLEAAQECAGGR